MSLADVKVGDIIVATNANYREPRRARVTGIGRKYVTVNGGMKFALADGSQAGRPNGPSWYAYTVEQWARREAESAFHDARRALDMAGSPGNLSDDALRVATEQIRAIVTAMRGA